jgi:hypothetical protein
MKMNTSKNNILALTSIILFCLAIICLSTFANSQSVNNQQPGTVAKEPNAAIGKQIDVLTKDTSYVSRRIAAHQLGQNGDYSACDALVQAVLTDSSYEVRLAGISAIGNILSKRNVELNKEVDKNLKTSSEAQTIISNLSEKSSGKYKELFKPDYKFNCEYPNEIKAAAVGCFFNPEDPNGMTSILLDELKKVCSLSFKEREKLEAPRPGRGSQLTSAIIGAISTPKMVRIVSPSKLVYSRNNNKYIIPKLEQEINKSTGDYKYCLILALYHISYQQDFSVEELKRVLVYQFKNDLLPECEDGLLKTESPGIKVGLVNIMRANNYVPKSSEAKRIMDEIIAQRNSGTRAGGRG